MNSFLTASQIINEWNKNREDNGCWKFVRVGDEYRFLHGWGCHTDVVGEGETATAGGMIGLRDKSWVALVRYSSTLNVQFDEKCERDISELLGLTFDIYGG